MALKAGASWKTALPSWDDGASKASIIESVGRVTREDSPDYVEPDARVAVLDNDGTMWSEKPMPIELGLILERFVAMAMEDESLRARQPWQAAYDKDYGWLAGAITKHYSGDDSDVKLLIGGMLKAFEGMAVDDYVSSAEAFLKEARHPTLGRKLRDCSYLPMIELLHFLEANGFTAYIASGGDRDFMRAVTNDVYGIPPERVIGSSNALRYEEEAGSVVYRAEPDVFDDGPTKPVRIWSRIGRRPIFAAGNSNDDIPMLQFAGGRTSSAMRLLVLHDDPDREFDYTAGAEKSLAVARSEGWNVVSVKNDWNTVFAPAGAVSA